MTEAPEGTRLRLVLPCVIEGVDEWGLAAQLQAVRQTNMNPDQRIVTTVPLQELWNQGGVVSTARGPDLGVDEIVMLLRGGQVRFVVANPGSRLEWISIERCFVFWKTEARPRLRSAHSERFVRDDYYYVATRWEHSSAGEPIVLLEMHH